jgi:L-malate glycosyltransferase
LHGEIKIIKICFLASAASIHSHKWINYFSDLDYEITWISLVPSSINISKNIDYHEMKGNAFFLLYKVRRLVLELNPDIVHVHYLGSYALLGLFSGANCIVSTPWGSDVIEGKKSFLKRQVLSRLLKKSKIITCDAYHMRSEVMDFDIHPSKVYMINFGIDTKRFSKQERNIDLLNKFGISEELTVVSLRNFEPVYDVKTLLFAAQTVLKKNPDIRFILVGKGTLEEELKQIARDLKIEKSICFAGFIDNQLLPYLLSSADIYVSTSLSDAGIAASTAEAMACETPVVITNSGENDKWVNNGNNGFLVPVSQSSELANCLIHLIENEKIRNKIGKNGRKIMLDNNDYLVEMKKMNDLYQKI